MSGEHKVRILAAGCYIPFAGLVLCLITLLRYPHSEFALYHIKQGIAVFTVWFLSLFILWMSVFVGLIFWFALLFYCYKSGRGAFKGLKIVFPGMNRVTPYIPAEAIYRHLTAEDFPRH